MKREGMLVRIEGDGGTHDLSVWLDDQDEFVVLQVDAGQVVSVRPDALRAALDFIHGPGLR